MTLRRNNWAGYEVGVTPTTATSGGASGEQFSIFSRSGSHTAVIEESPFIPGGRALRLTAPDPSTGVAYADFIGADTRQHSMQALVRVNAAPSAEFPPLTLRNSADGIQATSVLTTDNRISFRALSQSGTNTSPVLPAGLYQVDMRCVLATTPSTSNGGLYGRVINWTTKAVVFEYETTTASFGTSGSLFRLARFGKATGTGSANLTLGPVSHDDNLAAFITPPSDFLAPVGQASALSSTSLRCTWNAVPTATGYELQTSTTSGGTYTTIYTGSATQFDHTGRTAGTTTFYRVRATK
jgi:hypothetical protein